MAQGVRLRPGSCCYEQLRVAKDCMGTGDDMKESFRINIAFINSKSLLNSISIAGDWLARDPEWPEGWWTVINMPGFEESRQGLDNMVLSDAVDRCVLKPGGPTLLQATFQLLLGRPFSTPTTFHSQLSSLTWQPREYSAGENPNRCLCRTWSFPPTSCILVFPDRRSHWPSRQFPSA